MRLFEIRHQRTVEDSAAAQKLVDQAQVKFEEYQRLLQEQRLTVKREIDAALLDARKQEAELLAQSREQARAITQKTLETLQSQKDQVRKQLHSEVEQLAQAVGEQLLSRKV